MSEVIFDYSALSDAKSFAQKVVTGWDCMDSYRGGIQGKLSWPLEEWRLSGEDPYGKGYASSARDCIENKRSDLQSKRQIWIDLSDNLGRFLQYLKDTDEKVVKIFSNTSSAYIDYSGVGGFLNSVGDFLFNAFAVDLANSNGFTRAIFDWGKSVATEITYYKKQAEDWFRHGNGRYVLNIVGSVALTVASIAGAIVAAVSIPFTGGATAPIVVGAIGAIASGVSASISAYNTYYQVQENYKALQVKNDPGLARFHGNISKYSDYVQKTDFGSAEKNREAEVSAVQINRVQAWADAVSIGTSLMTTLFSKSITVVDDLASKKEIIKFDYSVGNIKNNVLKAFGFKVDKAVVMLDEVGALSSTTISNIDEIGETSVKILAGSQELKYGAATFEKTVDIIEGQKNITRTLTLDKISASSEYISMITSNGVVTQQVAAYSKHASASTTVIDYTLAMTSTKGVEVLKATKEAAKIAKATELEKTLHKIKGVFKIVKEAGNGVTNTTNFVKASDETRVNVFINDVVKKNYFLNQVDKYIYKYDAYNNKGYIMGDLGKKLEKLFTEEVNYWKVITAN